MCFNIGNIDRIVRVVFGMVLMTVGIFSNIFILAGMAVIPFVTGIIRYCPVYPALKIDTSYLKKA